MHAIFSLVFLVVIIFVAIVKTIENRSLEKERLLRVSTKYDGLTAERIRNKMFWEGQTAEQLVDSLGKPDGIDRMSLKTRNREVWKYQHQGANRYNLRITLDNGRVAKWVQRN